MRIRHEKMGWLAGVASMNACNLVNVYDLILHIVCYEFMTWFALFSLVFPFMQPVDSKMDVRKVGICARWRK